jgi:hypothetical protein
MATSRPRIAGKGGPDAALAARFNEVCARGDDAEIAAFLAEVEAAEAANEKRLTAPEALRNGARWYATQAIPVFPLQPRSEEPHPDGWGPAGATFNLAQIEAWWTRHPDANIGLPTGDLFDVIDVQPPAGYPSLADLRDADVLPPPIGKAITPRSGQHLFVRPGRGKTPIPRSPGITYRGRGDYVVAAPSVGANGRRYAWASPINLKGGAA